MIYVLLPVRQAQFALGYAAFAVLRALCVGALCSRCRPVIPHDI